MESHQKHILISVAVVVTVFLLLCAGSGLFFVNKYKDKVFPGVMIGGYSLGGKTQAEVENLVGDFNDQLYKKGLNFSIDNGQIIREFFVPASFIATDGGSSLELVSLNKKETAASAFAFGREKSFFQNWQNRINALAQGVSIKAKIDADNVRIKEVIIHEAGPHATPRANAKVVVDSIDYAKKLVVAHAQKENSGYTYDFDKAVKGMVLNVAELNLLPIKLESTQDKASVVFEDAQKLLPKLESYIFSGKIKLVFTDPSTQDKLSWVIDEKNFSEWISIEKTKNTDGKQDEPNFVLSQDRVAQFLQTTIASSVDREPTDAKLIIGENNKVKEFQASKDGIEINKNETYQDLNKIFQENSEAKFANAPVPKQEQIVEIKMVTRKPRVVTEDVNNLGIKEILGTGVSNYKGSPANRIKNIKNALKILNGILIKPGETFSLLAALRPFTRENGYLPELVIKGDRITPEIGGGLCQIGTTTFRTAMNSGLPIDERRNHSLVVSYYNDPANNNPGTDATIYDPAPDLKFTNDYKSYLLLTAETNEKTGDLIFRLWGTSDNRKGYYSPPEVIKWKSAGAKKIIKTTTIPVGKTQCQSAHPGADAKFTYYIEYANGERQERIFESSYRPLGAICLVGVTQQELDQETQNVQNSEIPIQTNNPDIGEIRF